MFISNINVADVPVTQGAGASAAMTLACFAGNNAGKGTVKSLI